MKLQGKFMLTAIGEHWVEPNEWDDGYWVKYFKLDGKVYAAWEDPDDGYRSYGCLTVVDHLLQDNLPPIEVEATTEEWDYPGDGFDATSGWKVVLRDCANGKEILTVGTDTSMDYYPCAIFRWQPENLSINQK